MNRSTFSKALQQPVSKASSANTSAGLRNLHQLIQLRWIAVVGQLLTIQATHYSLGLPLPLQAMLSIVAGMVVFNIASLLRWRTRRGVHDVELFIGLLIDVAALTAQLYLSGGIGNPFVFLYLLQIAVGAMLLRGGYIWSIVVVASACVVLLAQHSQPLPLATNVRDGWASPYVLGLLVCFMLNAILVVVFITRISHNLRRRDARLAAVRQRAAEEEHIVRMGLLASGAAHELGTPLATLAVILGDWKRIPALTQDPVLQEEIAEMEAQVKRCKTIVSGILMSAGEARGESSSQTPCASFWTPWCRTGAPRARWTPSSTTTCWKATAPWWPMPPWSKWFSMCWTMPGMHRRTGCACRRSAMPMRCESWSPTGAPAFRPPCSATSARPTSPPKGGRGAAWGCFCR